MRLLWPFTSLSMLFTLSYASLFVSERNSFEKLNLQSWIIPRYNLQYLLKWRKDAINNMIEKAILEANKKGVKVLSMGLMNQVKKHASTDLVLHCSATAAVVINSLPKSTTKIVMTGILTKVAYTIASALCQRGVEVVLTLLPEEYEKLRSFVPQECRDRLVLLTSIAEMERIVDDLSSFTCTALSFSLTLFSDLISFSNILFTIYPPLFLALFLYSFGGTALSVFLGKELLIASRNLEFFTDGYRYLIQILPVAPMFFSRKIEFGVINQSVSAFNHILGDFWLVVYQFKIKF
ncbi:unnamed protein product [Brassica oleracea]